MKDLSLVPDHLFVLFTLQIVFKGKSIFAQQVEKMKGSGARKEMMMETHETNQLVDIEVAGHQFGKKSLCIIHIQIHYFVYCTITVRSITVSFINQFLIYCAKWKVFFYALTVSAVPKIY